MNSETYVSSQIQSHVCIKYWLISTNHFKWYHVGNYARNADSSAAQPSMFPRRLLANVK